MASASYQTRRDEIETYFDRTAADAWAALTSDAPVSRIRRTVRRGRDAMSQTLMSWLPEDMTGSTLIDAGCGTGTLAIEAAQRGAEVVAVEGIAEEAGMRVGDVVLRMKGRVIDDAQKLHDVADAAEPGDVIPVLVLRQQRNAARRSYITLRVPEDD